MPKFRTVFPVVALVALGSGALMAQRGGMPAGPPVDPHSISGYWTLSFDGRRIPPASLLPSVTKAELDEYAQRDWQAIRYCNLLGTPYQMDTGRPIDIRMGYDAIIVAPENSPAPRYIYTTRSTHINPDVYDPSTNGDSIAHWEGNTLVVDTVGFHDTRGVLGIPGGGFKTSKTHLVERYSLLNNGQALDVEFTVTDPTVYRTPHTYEYRYSKLARQYEPTPAAGCDPYDEGRAKFLEGVAPGRGIPAYVPLGSRSPAAAPAARGGRGRQ